MHPHVTAVPPTRPAAPVGLVKPLLSHQNFRLSAQIFPAQQGPAAHVPLLHRHFRFDPRHRAGGSEPLRGQHQKAGADGAPPAR
eukprot:661867-Prorocentrum_minimum.AAC.1